MAVILNSKMSVQDTNLEFPPLNLWTHKCIFRHQNAVYMRFISRDIHKYYFMPPVMTYFNARGCLHKTPI